MKRIDAPRPNAKERSMNMNPTRLDDRINGLFGIVFIGLAVAVIVSALHGEVRAADAAVMAKALATAPVAVAAARERSGLACAGITGAQRVCQ
jgi:hypothetical protein